MYIELNRTFNPYLPPSAEPNETGEFPDERAEGRLTWAELYLKPVAVVLGEAGIGKTVALQLEASRLKEAGCFAFFISLTLLKSADDWQLALGSNLAVFTAWESSAEGAFFFFDAVDESRLLSHIDFTRALRIVQMKLGTHMARVHIVLSSRGTDWTVQAVSSAVMVELAAPIARARAASSDDADGRASPQSCSADDSMFVVTLAAGKVCIEIKPLDQTRSYSATSLVNDTLERQIATQYLKGHNSAHGILVLMQLDDKEWIVPGEAERSFGTLLKHLQLEAGKIKDRHSLARLEVFGIRCTI